MNQAIAFTDRIAGRKFYFNPGIASCNELVLHQNLIRELVYLQHELAGGLAEDGSVICINENLMRFLAPGGLESPTDNFYFHIVPEDRPRVMHYFSTLSEDHPEISFECRMISGDGDTRRVGWLIKGCSGIYPVRFLVLGYVLPVHPCHDSSPESYREMLDELVQGWNRQLNHIRKKIELEITRRRNIEKVLSRLISDVESEVITLKEVLQNVPGFLFVFDRSGNLQYVNRQGAELLGGPVHRLVGLSPGELGLPPEIRDLIGDMQNLDGDGASRGIVRTADRAYHYGLTALHGNDGSVTGVQLLMQDA